MMTTNIFFNYINRGRMLKAARNFLKRTLKKTKKMFGGQFPHGYGFPQGESSGGSGGLIAAIVSIFILIAVLIGVYWYYTTRIEDGDGDGEGDIGDGEGDIEDGGGGIEGEWTDDGEGGDTSEGGTAPPSKPRPPPSTKTDCKKYGKTIQGLCDDGQLAINKKCYTLPGGSNPANWKLDAPGLIGEKCPSGTSASGKECIYHRAVGVGKKATTSGCGSKRQHGSYCYNQCPGGYYWTGSGCQISKSVPLTIWKCGSGDSSCGDSRYRRTAACSCQIEKPVYSLSDLNPTRRTTTYSCPSGKVWDDGACYDPPKSGFGCTGTRCTKSRQQISQVGKNPKKCPSDAELHQGKCYKDKCSSLGSGWTRSSACSCKKAKA